MAVVMIGLVSLMLIPAFFRIKKQEPVPGTPTQQSAQPILPINNLQDEDPGQIRWDGKTLLLYPNPVRHTLFVAVPREGAAYVWLGIYQPSGQLVKQYTIESGRVIRLNVQELAMGNYLVRVADKKARSWSGKFFKA